MKLGKLGNKLRNELRRNPKKTAILGIVSLVGLYFWLPLLRGWLPGGPSKTAKVASNKSIAVAPVATEVVAISASGPATATPWDELLRQRKQDPLSMPAILRSDVRNPFLLSDDLQQAQAAQEEAEIASGQSAPPAKPPLDLTPQKLGLALQGTLVGPRVRAATINSRTYSRGAQIAVAAAPDGASESKQSETDRIEFTLAEVRKDHVVLTRGEQSYTLTFPRAVLSERDRIVLEKPLDE